MIKNTILLFSLIFMSQFNAQILDEYPKDQDFYEGGIRQFYKEINEYLIKNKVEECDSKEIYQPRIIVMKDKTVKLIQDSDVDYISKNKCAHGVSMEVIKNLKNWKPATVKGGAFSAITEFIIYPKDLMSGYKTNYNPYRYVTEALYPKGNKVFNKDFHDNFMSLFADYQIRGDVHLEFYVSREGEIVNPRIYPVINIMAFNSDFMRTLSRLKKTWKPALYSNIPIKQRIAIPLSFSIVFDER